MQDAPPQAAASDGDAEHTPVTAPPSSVYRSFFAKALLPDVPLQIRTTSGGAIAYLVAFTAAMAALFLGVVFLSY